jgi:hypothetical protein
VAPEIVEMEAVTEDMATEDTIVELGEPVLKHESPRLPLPVTVMSGLVLALVFTEAF